LITEAVLLHLWMGLMLPVAVWLICGVIDRYRWRDKPFSPAITDSSLGCRLNEWIVMHPATVIIGSWCALLTFYMLNCWLYA